MNTISNLKQNGHVYGFLLLCVEM